MLGPSVILLNFYLWWYTAVISISHVLIMKVPITWTIRPSKYRRYQERSVVSCVTPSVCYNFCIRIRHTDHLCLCPYIRRNNILRFKIIWPQPTDSSICSLAGSHLNDGSARRKIESLFNTDFLNHYFNKE